MAQQQGRGVRLWLVVAACLSASLAGAAPAAAQEETGSAKKWQFEVTPYFFAAGLDGTVGVEGVTGTVNMGVGDILDRLDSAFMGLVEARTGDWGVLFDGMYVHLKDESTKTWQSPGGSVTITGEVVGDATQRVYGIGLARRVVDAGSMVDVVFGTRYTNVESDLKLTVTTGGTFPGGSRSVSDQQGWWDPVFGMRLVLPFAEHWTAAAYADIGGFGVASDVTSQVIAGVNWAATKRFILKGGYRVLFDDYNNDGFVWNMATHGLYAGVGIRF